MDKLLSVEEAAELLGVEYKTVYKLIRAGELSAGRVGRVYRVKQSDLEEFFERSKAVAQGVQCSVCGKRLISVLSVGVRCEICGAPICVKCAGTRDIKRCPEHEKTEKPREEKADEKQ